MNKSVIKNFAIWARNKLVADITYQMRLLGIDENGIKTKLPQSTTDTEFYDVGTREPYQVSGEAVHQRRDLVRKIEQKAKDEPYADALKSVVEEVAYTWFNRLIAIRFMEVNDYLPGRQRVLSAESENKVEPELVTAPFESDLKFTDFEREQILEWQENNKIDELFRMLFIKACNSLNAYLPELFERTKDYTELLLNLSVIDPEGVVSHLVHDIPESDFNIGQGGQVEIIGWLYQYYNKEPKDKVFANLKKNIKISKDNIPAATQMFTPDWIVRYMVENSLGRMWIEGHKEHKTDKEMAEEFDWKYYLPEAQQEESVEKQLQTIREEYSKLNIEDIKFIDPCMGSGHILVYAFDVFMQIYLELGYDEKEAAESILQHNLYGLDIDDRAFQLSYFALFMKARQYNRRILSKGIELNICTIQESNGLRKWADVVAGVSGPQMKLDDQFIRMVDELIETFYDAKEYGSILNVEPKKYDALLKSIKELKQSNSLDLVMSSWVQEFEDRIPELIKQAKIMSNKYELCVTNPPYMGANGMGQKLSNFVKKHYPMTKSDLSMIFMERSLFMIKRHGIMGMINIPVWMFLASYEKLREFLLKENTYINMVHCGRGIFGSDFGTTAFIIRNGRIGNYTSTFRRLFNKPGAVDSVETKRQWFLENRGLFFAKQENFAQIPGMPVAYSISEKVLLDFQYAPIGDTVIPRHGLATSDNDRFLRLWMEIDSNKASIFTKCDFAKKWFPMNKGGDYRKWYGNLSWLINYENNGAELKEYAIQLYKSSSRTIQNTAFYFKEGLTWSALTSGNLSFRWTDRGAVFGSGAHCAFAEDVNEHPYALGLMNSNVYKYLLDVLSPGLNKNVDDIRAVPLIINSTQKEKIDSLVLQNINLSKSDWNSFETSWDFKRCPLLSKETSSMTVLIGNSQSTLEDKYEEFKAICEDRFDILKANEEELNRIFIDIYGLQDELTSEVADKDITVARIYDTKEEIPESMKGNNYVLTKADVAKSLLSYAVGCMFGRYSLDVDGLAYAGGEWDSSKYETFIPDKDNVIPIMDESYSEDDIVDLFVGWMKKAFGRENLEDNLHFIADALGIKGSGSRERIRQYFLKDFYKDHVKLYKKRPIYWLYDSGKKEGFKALVYMHRYDEDTTGRVRVDYLHRVERIYESEINRMTQDIEHSNNARETSKATKRREKLQKQLKECQEYDEQIAQPALARIAIDLDDGVKVNYEKVQSVGGKIYRVLAKI